MPPLIALVGCLGAQAAAMAVDELHFHRRRRLPRWERIGHPLDTATVLAVFVAFCVLSPGPAGEAPPGLVALMTLSCLFITKDEWVHHRCCQPAEQWLHAVLFVLHPVTLLVAFESWRSAGATAVHRLQAALLAAFGIYQAVFWNLVEGSSHAHDERR